MSADISKIAVHFIYKHVYNYLLCSAVFSSWLCPYSFRKMTSSNGNIFRVTGRLCGEFTGPRWIPHTKASDAELWFFFICAWINGWVNKHEAGDLRRHRAHYDVIEMRLHNLRWFSHPTARYLRSNCYVCRWFTRKNIKINNDILYIYIEIKHNKSSLRPQKCLSSTSENWVIMRMSNEMRCCFSTPS